MTSFRLWKARGAFPGLGSALSAFGYEWGFQHGSLLAYEIELLREREGDGDPWALVNAVMNGPAKLGGPVAKLLTDGLRKGWKRLPDERRSQLQLLARCAFSESQALRMYDNTARAEAGIEASVADLLRNPYLLFECDRRAIDSIAFGVVDRGLFPDASLRQQVPVPESSGIEDPADERRVRALVVDLLEEAAAEGQLLRAFCSLPGLSEKGLLLLAPTGKARVRLEHQTRMQGFGQTLAQFLIRQQRYDGETGAYFPKPRAPRCSDYRTVVVDECSMLTEEQLAALIDSLSNVERLVLVGGPRQLPPIGAGRPFVDIVRELAPENVETHFPRCGSGLWGWMR